MRFFGNGNDLTPDILQYSVYSVIYQLPITFSDHPHTSFINEFVRILILNVFNISIHIGIEYKTYYYGQSLMFKPILYIV